MERQNRFWILLGIAAALMIALYLAASHRPPVSTAATNSKATASHALAPEFSVIDLDGHALHSATYKGDVVILDFWATWCEPCREEIPHFVQMQSALKGRGFQVIGISMDDEPQPVRKFYEQFQMNYPVALGGARIAELYGGIFGLPSAYLIGRDGKIYSKHVGAIDFPAFEAEVNDRLDSK
jgi:thiol-disulfide isomerase/thioredoxin